MLCKQDLRLYKKQYIISYTYIYIYVCILWIDAPGADEQLTKGFEELLRGRQGQSCLAVDAT